MIPLVKSLVKSLPGIKRIVDERNVLRAQVLELSRTLDQIQGARPPQTPPGPGLRLQEKVESGTGRPVHDPAHFENHGYCYCCDTAVKFVAHGSWWRDQYLCSNCRSIPRERAIMYCIDKFAPGWRDLIVHESSPATRGASVRLKAECPKYIGSQYYDKIPPGAVHDGFRCENLEALTFADNSVDLHISQDVFEHIFDPRQAFREIARTLKPGGAHIFTTPLVNKDRATSFRARWGAGGEIEHLVPKPEYHGNPISTEGSLVTVHWGYDICEYIHQVCGLHTRIIYIDALDLGIRADLIEVLITSKPGV